MLFSDGDRVAGAVPPAFVRGGANAFTFDDHERGTGAIAPAKLAGIDACFLESGLVLLQDVIPTEVLGRLVPRLEEDVLRQVSPSPAAPRNP